MLTRYGRHSPNGPHPIWAVVIALFIGLVLSIVNWWFA
jgi:hypothetical protein